MRAYVLIARADSVSASRSHGPPTLALKIDIGSLPLGDRGTLSPENVVLVGQDDFEAKLSASRGAWIAYTRLSQLGLVHPRSRIGSHGIVFDLGKDGHVSGPSAGLAFLVATAAWILEDHRRLSGLPELEPECVLAATGVLASVDGTAQVRPVTSLEAKLAVARQAVGEQGQVFYPASSQSPRAQAEARMVSVATAHEAVDRVAALYGVRSGSRGLRPGVAMAVAGVLAAGVLVAAWRTGPREEEPATSMVPAVAVAPSVPPAEPVPRAVPAPQLQVELFREGGDGAASRVAPEQALREGDGFRLRVRLGSAGFLYVFDIDGRGRLFQLFPDGSPAVRQEAGTFWVPGGDRWWELDGTVGTERILAAVAHEPVSWLEELGRRVDRTPDASFEERETLARQLEEGLVRDRDQGRLAYARIAFQHR